MHVNSWRVVAIEAEELQRFSLPAGNFYRSKRSNGVSLSVHLRNSHLTFFSAGEFFVRFRVLTSKLDSSLPAVEQPGRSVQASIRLTSGRRTSAKRRLLIEHLSARRVLASVSGLVFEDLDQSWRHESTESGLASRVVFIDNNDNGELDENESFALTNIDGRFQFEGLVGDESIIRLFNGSATAPLPRFPVTPSVDALIELEQGNAIARFQDNLVVAIAGDKLLRSDLGSSSIVSTTFPASIRAAESLPDGRLLVLASDTAGNHAFTLDSSGTISPIALEAVGPTAVGTFQGWADVAIDASGNGVLVEQSNGETLLRAITIGESIAVGATSVSVAAGTRVTSGGDVTSVISVPTDDGMRLRLWSNATGTEIGTGVEIVGGSEVLGYDDASGLVLLRTAEDAVTLLDAAAGFASLQTINGVPGPVTLDPSRELLFAVSPSEAALQIIDLKSANILGQFALATSDIATAKQVAFDSTTGKLLVLTAAGLAPVTLQRSNAHRIKTAPDAASYDLLFALDPSSLNGAPRFDSLPELIVAEDATLTVPSPKLLDTASDPEDDKFIVILETQAQNGVVVITPTGGLGYVPNRDYFGIDQFTVILHDGQTASEPIELFVNVTPVDDPLIIEVVPKPIPEDAELDFIAGVINVVHADGGNIVWNVNDPRFIVLNQALVVAPGATFNYADEPTITVQLRATHEASGEQVTSTIDFTVEDVVQPIQDIRPDVASVDENRPGDLIAELSVLGDGTSEDFLFTVDDDRFRITFRDLRLKPGIALNYELEPTVTVNITATNAAGDSKTEPLVINVRDIPEQPVALTLSPQQIKELVRGADVGDLMVDGAVMSSAYRATVEDSRFTVEGSTLKLRDTQFVRRADQQEIQLLVSVRDVAGQFTPITGTFVIDVLENANPFHNTANPYDVNDDGQVNPLDALLIINSMSRNGGPGPISGFPLPDRFYDVNGDEMITALDALLIINFLNRRNRGNEPPTTGANGEAPEGEGSSSATTSGVAGSAPASSSPAAPDPTSGSNNQRKRGSNDEQSAFSPSLQGEGEASGERPATVQTNRADLVRLRDEVLELLSTDTLSSEDEVDAAIDDFL